jgi:tRNA uridine 5-carboxymethylaminomethyl modification enzyme
LANRLQMTPTEAARHGLHLNRDGIRRTAFELLAHPGVDIARLSTVWPELRGLDRFVAEQIEIDAKYAVYLDRQRTDIESFRRDEGISLDAIEFDGLAGLSNELREKLAASQPATLGQAARIDGMTPAALALLLAEVKRGRARGRSAA